MPEMSDLGSRFHTEYRTLTGKRIVGHLWQRPPVNAGASSFLASRRTLKVPVDSPAVPGDVITLLGGGKFILLNGSDSEAGGTRVYRLFTLLQTDRQMTLKRSQTEIHRVTGMAGKTSDVVIGQFWCVFEPLTQVEDINFPTTKYRIVSAAPMQVGDTIDTYSVKRVDMLLGVYVAEVA